MWLIARYLQSAPFSLRISTTTSSGGRTHLVPSPYAVKMALIDAAFRAGYDGRAVFESVKHLAVRFRPPRYSVVNQTFVKILKEDRNPGGDGPYTRSIGYREFVFGRGLLHVALDVSPLAEDQVRLIEALLWHVQYFGKRGSFVQAWDSRLEAELPAGYSFVVGQNERSAPADLIVQHLDDFGPGVTFEAINTYSEAALRLGRDRILVTVGLPYRKMASSRLFSVFHGNSDPLGGNPFEPSD